MTEFIDRDLSGARFERVSLRNASFAQVHLNDARMRRVDLSGAEIRGALLRGVRMRGLELCDVEISGELENVTVNGVDIGPLVDQELNRRMPERAKMRPDDVGGFQPAHRAQRGMGAPPLRRTRPCRTRRSRRPLSLGCRRRPGDVRSQARDRKPSWRLRRRHPRVSSAESG